MKNQEMIQIEFEYNGEKYSTCVFKHASTAIILPNKTVLATNTLVHSSGSRRNKEDTKRVRQIFDFRGKLIPPSIIRKPGDWIRPLDTRLPIVFAELVTS